MYNVYRQCFLLRRVGADVADSPAHGTTRCVRKRQPPRKRPHATKRAHRRRQRDAEPTAATDKPAREHATCEFQCQRAAGWAAPSSRPLGAPHPGVRRWQVCARRCRASDGRACVAFVHDAQRGICYLFDHVERLVPDPQHAGFFACRLDPACAAAASPSLGQRLMARLRSVFG